MLTQLRDLDIATRDRLARLKAEAEAIRLADAARAELPRDSLEPGLPAWRPLRWLTALLAG